MRKKTKDEVFTDHWTVHQMLKPFQDQILTKTFLEPSAGDGNFLVNILQAKLNSLAKHLSKPQWYNQCLIALSTIYGIELFSDNVKISHQRMMKVVKDNYARRFKTKLTAKNQPFIQKVQQIIRTNVVQGNTLTLKNKHQQPIRLYRWKHGHSIASFQPTNTVMKLVK